MVCRRIIVCCVFAALGLLSAAAPLAGQTLNPNVVEFLPPVNASQISGYNVAFYAATALDPFLIVNLGKPAPQADGLIRADIVAAIGIWPQPNTLSVARVVAVTTAGSNLSVASNQFTYTCEFTLSSTAMSFPAGGGNGSVGLTTPTWCAWKTTSAASWITVMTGSSGNGSATITYAVAPNTSTATRTGTLTIGGMTYTVSQAAATATNAPPAIRIVKPGNGETVKAASIKIDASASDSDGTVTSVAFYANGVLIGAAAAPSTPTIRWTPIAGTYTLTALATDNRGATTWSAPVSVVVR